MVVERQIFPRYPESGKRHQNINQDYQARGPEEDLNEEI
jgi:hypothetical protein